MVHFAGVRELKHKNGILVMPTVMNRRMYLTVKILLFGDEMLHGQICIFMKIC